MSIPHPGAAMAEICPQCSSLKATLHSTDLTLVRSWAWICDCCGEIWGFTMDSGEKEKSGMSTAPRLLKRHIPKEDTMPTATDRYKTIRRAMNESAISDWKAGIDYDTPEAVRLLRELAEAERRLPWWRGWVVAWRIDRELVAWMRRRGPFGGGAA